MQERRTERFQAKVTGRHAITLPAELCRQLDIEIGDRVELMISGQQATLTKVIESPLPPARGILRGTFESVDAVQHYIDEERRGWIERESTLMDQRTHHRQPSNSSDT